MEDYLKSKNIEEAVNAVKEIKAPKHFLSEMLNKMVVFSLDRSDEDKELASTLIHALCTEGIVTGENLMQVSLLTCLFNKNKQKSENIFLQNEYETDVQHSPFSFNFTGIFECFGPLSKD